jgi:hypothetical protein
MTDYKIIFGYTAAIISVASYIPYYKSIFSGKTKPHAFTWLIWSILSSTAFFAQFLNQAGPGSWVTGVTALTCFGVFVLSLFKGYKDFVLFDYFALAGAAVALVAWYLQKDPTLSVILVAIVDNLGFLPTFRKSYINPFTENLVIYKWSIVKYIFAFFAFESYTFVTLIFPISLVFFNIFFVLMVYYRRSKVAFK